MAKSQSNTKTLKRKPFIIMLEPDIRQAFGEAAEKEDVSLALWLVNAGRAALDKQNQGQ
jgi:hypothetical protein